VAHVAWYQRAGKRQRVATTSRSIAAKVICKQATASGTCKKSTTRWSATQGDGELRQWCVWHDHDYEQAARRSVRHFVKQMEGMTRVCIQQRNYMLGNSGKPVTLETSSLTKFSKHVFQEQGIRDFRKPRICEVTNSRMCRIRES
jgi:hypothetical protein